MRIWAQIDGTTLFPPSMALKVIEHARFVQQDLAVHQLSSTLDPSGGSSSPDPYGGVWFAHLVISKS